MPRRLAARREQLNASLKSALLPRFLDCVVSAAEAVKVDLAFSLDGNGLCRVRGHLQTEVRQHCQRCLREVSLQVKADINLCIVKNDEAARLLPKDQDPFIMSGSQVSIEELVEDGLIMALPMVYKHQDCRIDASSKAAQAETDRPFALLRVDKKGQVNSAGCD